MTKKVYCSNCSTELYAPFCYTCRTSNFLEVRESDTREADKEYVLSKLKNKKEITTHWSEIFEAPAICDTSKLSIFELNNILDTTEFTLNTIEAITDEQGNPISVVAISFTDAPKTGDVMLSAYFEL